MYFLKGDVHYGAIRNLYVELSVESSFCGEQLIIDLSEVKCRGFLHLCRNIMVSEFHRSLMTGFVEY